MNRLCNTFFLSVNESKDEREEMSGMHGRGNEKEFDYSEIKSAVRANKSGKATKVGNITAEMVKGVVCNIDVDESTV